MAVCIRFYCGKWETKKANFLNMAVFMLEEAFMAWEKESLGKDNTC